ncbi:ribonuclease III domain-containing protein [Lactarius quietus]|nr:ribonuclease III domain-containing protein [Lactarius quietus]
MLSTIFEERSLSPTSHQSLDCDNGSLHIGEQDAAGDRDLPHALEKVASSSSQPVDHSPSHSSSIFSERSFALPPLPQIRDGRLLAQIFTHRSLTRKPKRSFEDYPDDPSPDNEQLVQIGDPVFSLVVTDLIRDLFPHLSIGPSNKIRDRLKHTATLARVAVLYRLHERLQVQTAQANEVKASQSAQAEVFKAYVGGLYREQGMGPVNTWLRSLFQLYVQDAYENERREHLLPRMQAQPPPAARRIL